MNGVVGSMIGDDDIFMFVEWRDNIGDCWEGLCINDIMFGIKVSGDVGFCFDVYILGFVELWWVVRFNVISV